MKRKIRLAAALIIVAAAVVYGWGGLDGEFVFDDEYTVLHNPHIKSLWPPREAFAAPVNSPLRDRPVVSLTFSVSYALSGMNVAGWRSANLLVHIASALLLFGLIRRTLADDRIPPELRKASPGIAAAVALLWTVHPLQTSAVTYVTQRCESLAGFFYLAVLYCAIRSASSRRPAGWIAAAIVASILGMGTKAVMVTVPVAVLIYDRLFLSGSFKELWKKRGALYSGLVLSWGLLFYLVAVTPYPDIKTHRWWEYALTQPAVILHYLRLVFYPRPLVLDYGWQPALAAARIIPALLPVSAVFAATVIGLFRRRPWSFLGAWFFLILAPTSSVLPLEDLAFEHRMYLPLAAVILAAAALFWKALVRFLPGREKGRLVLAGSATLVLAVVLGLLTVGRNRDYRSSERIWRANLAARPGNPRAYNFLGNSLSRSRRPAEAERVFRAGLEVDHTYSPAHYNLALLLQGQGRLEEAARHYRTAVRHRPEFAESLNNLGVVLLELGRTEEGLEAWKESIRIEPGDPAPYFNLAKALAELGRIEEARIFLAGVLELRPDHAPAHELARRLSRARDGYRD